MKGALRSCFATRARLRRANIKGNIVAIYHLSVKAVSRSSGRSATAAAAYRAGVVIADARTGQVHDYTRKRGVLSSHIVLPGDAPKWATDRAALWNAAELAERRKDACVAREFEAALPAELSSIERERLVLDFAREIADAEGCAVDASLHAPDRRGDNRNWHVHMLRTTRRVGADGLTDKLDTEKAGRNRKADLEAVRARWAELVNERLKENGVDARVDHRSLARQGIDRTPTEHLGPSAIRYEQRTGRPSLRREWLQHRDVETRLRQAAETGALEREARAIGSEIVDLETNLRSALAERDQLRRVSDYEQRRNEFLRIDPDLLLARRGAANATGNGLLRLSECRLAGTANVDERERGAANQNLLSRDARAGRREPERVHDARVNVERQAMQANESKMLDTVRGLGRALERPDTIPPKILLQADKRLTEYLQGADVDPLLRVRMEHLRQQIRNEQDAREATQRWAQTGRKLLIVSARALQDAAGELGRELRAVLAQCMRIVPLSMQHSPEALKLRDTAFGSFVLETMLKEGLIDDGEALSLGVEQSVVDKMNALDTRKPGAADEAVKEFDTNIRAAAENEKVRFEAISDAYIQDLLAAKKAAAVTGHFDLSIIYDRIATVRSQLNLWPAPASEHDATTTQEGVVNAGRSRNVPGKI
jgi:hypothetical protein